jgi:tetratricopeptide (TPR) repeat protein
MRRDFSPIASYKAVPGVVQIIVARQCVTRGLRGLAVGILVSVSRAWSMIFVGALIQGLAGCESALLPPPSVLEPAPVAVTPPPTPTVEQPANVQYYPSDEPLRLGLEHFNRGHYGIAERYFRDAVERAPRDVTAWVGLAATYDRIGRYVLADRAYASAIKLGGETVEILNNQGYSYMLRGDFPSARKKFLRAYAREPNNPTVLNNLKLLDGSRREIRRTPDFESMPQ